MAWWSWKAGPMASRDLSTWAPLAATSVVRFATLLLLTFFHRPEIVGLGLPLVQALGGPEASHYPDHLLQLPQVFAGVDPWILVLLGGPAALGVVRSLIPRLIPGALPPAGHGLRTMIDAMLCAALVVALAACVDLIFDFLPEALRNRGGKMGLALAMAHSGVLVLVLSPLLCSFSALAVHGDRFFAAVRRSTRIASSEPITVLLLAAWPIAVALPFDVLSGRIGRDRFGTEPEAMLVVVAAGLLVEIFTAHATLAAATRLVAWRASEDR